MSRWPIRKIYLYSVCLVSMLFILFGTYSAIDHFVNALYPVNYGPAPIDMWRTKEVEGETTAPEDVIEAQRAFFAEQQRAQQRRDLAHGAARLLSAALVAVPVFVFHWRQTRPDD